MVMGTLDRAYKSATKATHLQRSVIAGTLIGSTGTLIAVTAMVTDLSNDKGSIARLFRVVRVATDSKAAAAFAESVAGRLHLSAGTESAGSEEPGFEKSAGPACRLACKNTRDSAYDTCDLSLTGCTAVAVGSWPT